MKVAVSYEKVVQEEQELDLPEIKKFYGRTDDGNFFPRGRCLFAILPRYKTNPTHSYMLIHVERNKQDSTDFVPIDDLKGKIDGLRKEAYDLFHGTNWLKRWEEITEEQFDTEREKLINNYKTE